MTKTCYLNIRGCVIVGAPDERLIATPGLTNLVIVEQDNCLVIFDRRDQKQLNDLFQYLTEEQKWSPADMADLRTTLESAEQRLTRLPAKLPYDHCNHHLHPLSS